MATGFIYSGSNYATPDKTLSRKSQPRTRTAVFGDGYEQRIIDGINSLQEEYYCSFRNRTKEFIDDVVTFLEDKKGVTSFTFVVPDTNSSGNEKSIKVVCKDFDTIFEYDDYYTLSLTLKRVYEA
jgi:phage-related protein